MTLEELQAAIENIILEVDKINVREVLMNHINHQKKISKKKI